MTVQVVQDVQAARSGVRLAVIHWFPLEQYPPAQNLLNYFSNRPDFDVLCCTTSNDRGWPSFHAAKIQFRRRPFPGRAIARWYRLWLFLTFPFFVFWQLFRFKPDVLLYMEPHSSFPAWLYTTCRSGCRLFIHYHEYRDRKEYRDPGNRVMAIYHWFERHWLYRRAVWISHTNEDRVRMFLADLPTVPAHRMRVMPNLPPKAWMDEKCSQWPLPHQPLRLVYAGAVSRRDTFIEQIIEWAKRHPESRVTLDLLINNVDADTQEYLQNSAGSQIRVNMAGVGYHQLPELLKQFHVGLILYRGNTSNYVYNAPNKLFEYLACGLDVWYPGVMQGVKPFARGELYPRVVEVDFENMALLDLETVTSRSELPASPWTQSCETELAKLEAVMTEVSERRE
jgi:hypothetical protein